jgi:electron transfer flavoprotein beta subunit
MKILVCVKYVPDATGNRAFTADHLTDRASVDGQLSELDEYAIEQALKIVEAGNEAEIVYLTMGPADASTALRKALSMGGDSAIHVTDDALAGSDYLATSRVLAAAAQKAGFDLIICGMASTDSGGWVIPAMLAERLGVPQATLAGEISLDGQTVTIRRDGDKATERVAVTLPAVVSVTDQTGEARYPSFKGIMAAKKKPVETWGLADLGIDPAQVGTAGSTTKVLDITARPPRTAGTVVADEGDGGVKLAEYLSAQKFI